MCQFGLIVELESGSLNFHQLGLFLSLWVVCLSLTRWVVSLSPPVAPAAGKKKDDIVNNQNILPFSHLLWMHHSVPFLISRDAARVDYQKLPSCLNWL